MSFIELLLIGLGLSMDAAAVSICKGLAAGRAKARHCLIAGVYFGGFQALMPLIGYALGRTFADFINRYDHWVAFVLLVLIGGNMLRESFQKEEECCNACFGAAAMLPLAIATSIDALAVGVSYSFYLNWAQLWMAIAAIGVITFAVSAAAVKIGSVFGARYKTASERLGGIILILMGIKILLEGLGFWF
ncbi:MAG: manganese efflux pump [Clostridia bacterium]|nr:manganese efflux pump [Clostridia bacterium]